MKHEAAYTEKLDFELQTLYVEKILYRIHVFNLIRKWVDANKHFTM